MQALADPLEVRLERINRRADFHLQNIERFQHGDIIPLWKNYLDGRIRVYVHAWAGADASADCIAAAIEPARISEANHMDNELIPSDSCEFPMLVRVGNIAEGFRPLDSVVRLQAFNARDMRYRQSLELGFGSRIEPTSLAVGISLEVLDEELRSVLSSPTVFNRQLIDEVIEGRPKMVDGRTHQNGSLQGNIRQAESAGRPDYKWPGAFKEIVIVIGERFLFVAPDETFQKCFKLHKAFVGPAYVC